MNIVAIGIIFRDSQVLLVFRKFSPQLWSPPGGFIDEGETPEEAIERESWEETGVICKAISKIHEFIFNQSHILVYTCSYISGDLKCSYESTHLGWFDINNLPSPISPDVEIFKNALLKFEKPVV